MSETCGAKWPVNEKVACSLDAGHDGDHVKQYPYEDGHADVKFHWPRAESQPQQVAIPSCEHHYDKSACTLCEIATLKEELGRAEAALRLAKPILEAFAREHPVWRDFTGREQDPAGVHALLATHPKEGV